MRPTVEISGAEQCCRDALAGVDRLLGISNGSGSHEFDDPVAYGAGVDAKVALVLQAFENSIRERAEADLQGIAISDQTADVSADFLF